MSESDKLASRDHVKSFIKTNIKEHVGCTYSNHLDLVEKILISEEDSSQKIKNFLDWCQGRKFVRLVKESIPNGILSQNASLYDIKIKSRGPDDRIFDRNEDIRAKIARGNSILEYKENDIVKYKLLIYALRKFTGGLGDEDEFDRKFGEWQKYFLKDIKYSQYVMSLQKANGEAAHLSCSWIKNDFLLCAGSKNVHLVFRNKFDLIEYTNDRYEHAKLISRSIIDFLDKMTVDVRRNFLSFLCWSNLTIVFEILLPDLQHIEDISAHKQPYLQFITFTENKVLEKPQSLCAMPPDCATELGKIFGLIGVKYEKIPLNNIDDYLLKVRTDHAHEGVVLYFIDADLNIIGMLKKKTTWYIILRAMREKIKIYLSPKSNWKVDDLKRKMSDRLSDIRTWIGFSSVDLEKWEKLCHHFCEWFDRAYHSNSKLKNEFNERYPVVWKRFLSENNLSDRIKLHIEKKSHTTLGDQEPENEK